MNRASKELLGQGFSQGLGSIVQGFGKHLQTKREEELYRTIQDPNASVVQKSVAMSKLPKERQAGLTGYLKQEQENAQGMQILQQFLGQQRNAAVQQAQTSPFEFQGSPLNGVMNQAGMQMGTPMQQQGQKEQPQQEESIARRMQEELTTPQLIELGSTKGQVGTLANKVLQNRQQEENRKNKQDIAEKQLRSKESIAAFNATKEYRQKILAEIPASKKRMAQLDKLKSLNKTQEATSPLMYKALNTFGIPLGVLKNPTSEQIEKLALDLTGNIQSEYGSRVPVSEFNIFLRRLPTLMNSKEGRDEIIQNMELYELAKQAEQKAFSEISKEFRSKGLSPPMDLHELAVERAEPELDSIFSKFRENLVGKNKESSQKENLPPSPQGTVRLQKDGRIIDAPASVVQKALSQGFQPL